MRTGQDSTPADTEGGAKSVAPQNRFLLPILVTLIIVGVFVGGIFLMMSKLRERLRAKVMEQDSIVLQAATAAQDEMSPESQDDQMANALTAAGANDQVIGVRLYDTNGRLLNAIPKNLLVTQLSPDALEAALLGNAHSRFEPSVDVKAEHIAGTFPEDLVAPVVFVTIPIRSQKGEVKAAAEFLLFGFHIVGQLREIDREMRQSAMQFGLVGGITILLVLGWAFSRLGHANRLLAERTANLLRANHELTLAAKTSAVGAVAAHLIHGLKNPLFGLQAFVAVKSESEAGNEWKAAIDSTRRMQQMIQDVVRIMREESGQSGYEVNMAELVGILDSKLSPQAKEASVALELQARGHRCLPNREANLIILVLTNLIQNAIQASKPGQKITLQMSERDAEVCFDLHDQAGGLPPTMMAHLFTPCQSSKKGGTGLGLAISKQLANHLGGKLELVKTDKEGTTFRLTIPREIFVASNSKDALEPANAIA
jgi:signal transduction histidine kinase